MKVSNRVLQTDPPLMSSMRAQLAKVPGVASLAQGMVHWKPPKSAVEKTTAQLQDGSIDIKFHAYGMSVFGEPNLKAKLQEKLKHVNNLSNQFVCVTQGANQGFADIVLCLTDPGDEAIIFRPYYFNHLMALQLGDVTPIYVDCVAQNSFLPDIKEVEQTIKQRRSETGDKLKMVVLCNPCNPTGAVWPKELVDRLAEICLQHGLWLISDEAYENFVYSSKNQQKQEGSLVHYSPEGDHIIHLYSFSKSFGLHGWRVGYVSFSNKLTELIQNFEKIQDTIPVTSCVFSQELAYQCLSIDEEFGETFIKERRGELYNNRDIVWSAIQNGFKNYQTESLFYTQGAIYFFIPIPNLILDKESSAQGFSKQQEIAVIEWLARKHKIFVVPGQCFGKPGSLRVSYANVPIASCEAVAKRLEAGLQELCSGNVTMQQIEQFVLESKAALQ